MRNVSSLLLSAEAQEQIALLTWVRLHWIREPRLTLLHHIPNGEHRAKQTAARLQAMGVLPGVPDLCLPVACHGYHGDYLELKSRHGRITPAQVSFMHAVKAQGYYAEVFRSWDDAARHLCWYLGREDLLEGF